MLFSKTIQQPIAGVVFSGVLLGMSACSSSDSGSVDVNDETQTMADETAAADPDILTADGEQTGTDTIGEPTDTIEEPTDSVDIDSSENMTPENLFGDEPDVNQNEEETADPVFIPLVDDEVDAGVDAEVDAGVDADSELGQLIGGLTRQAAITLLDLNSRISQGEELTEQQAQCLGSFEEGFGQPLLAINCDQALATDEIALFVGEATFYDTEACTTALFEGNADECVLQSMDMLISTTFTSPANGLPRPLFAGAQVSYAADDTILTIESIPAALTGAFSCEINLENGGSTAQINSTDCDELVISVADEIEDRQTP